MNRNDDAWHRAFEPFALRLESEWLPDWIAARRWYQGKAGGIARVRLIDGALLDHDEATGRAAVLAFAEVEDRAGAASLYQLPLVVVRDAGNLPASVIIGRADDVDPSITVADGLADAAIPRLLMEAIREGATIATSGGRISAASTSAAADLIGDPSSIGPARLSGAEQSHSNVILGDRLLLKVFRKLDEGTNPDVEIGRFLTERTTFRNLPRLAGAIEFDVARRRGASAMLQEFIPSRGQGWEWVLGRLDAYLTGRTRPGAKVGPVAAALQESIDAAVLLGRRTAELHLALASAPDDPDFAFVPFEQADWAATREELLSQARRTSATLDRVGSGCPQEVCAEARGLIDRLPTWLDAQDRGAFAPGAAGSKLRVHGDYHLGQTLRTADDFILLDFEGEPSKSIDQRRRKQTPLRDVVGMLRSFDYAGYSALDALARRDSVAADAVSAHVREWVGLTSSAFRTSYEVVVSRAPWAPRDQAALDALLARLLVEKALYELDYELNNRPTWAMIPLRGLRGLLDR